MPGRSPTSSSAWAARVPEPRGRPRRPLDEPTGGGGWAPRRAGLDLRAGEGAWAASRRLYSSTSGRSSFSRAWISLRFSSRKSAIRATLSVQLTVTTYR